MIWMNLAGYAFLMVFWFVLTNSERVSIVFIRLFQSLLAKSFRIFLNSSINIGSTGLETRLFCFLKVFEVVLNPYGAVMV